MGLIHRFLVISNLVYGTGGREVPRKQLNGQTNRFLCSASSVCALPQWQPLQERSPNCWESEAMHQIIWDLRPPISVEVSVNPSMKSRLAPLPLPRLARLVLLYARDDDFKTVVRQALWDTGTVLLIAQTVEEALQIVCRRKRELDVAIMAFNEDCHGITLLGAIHDCCEQLPTLVVVDKDSEQASSPRLREWRTLLPEQTRLAGRNWPMLSPIWNRPPRNSRSPNEPELLPQRHFLLSNFRSTSARSSLEQRFWFRRSQDLLKTRIVP